MTAIIGRDAELRAVDAAMARVAGGGAATVVVVGEAGIGKSRLLHEIADRAGAHGFRVLMAAGDELDSDRPFGLVARALRLDTTGPVGVEAIVAAAEELAAGGPVTVVVDDLHWADRSTLLAVAAIAQSVTGVPLLLALATRPPAGDGDVAFLVDLLIGGGATSLTLGALKTAEAETLAAEVLGETLGQAERQRIAAAKGNPLYVLELARALVATKAPPAPLPTLLTALMRRFSGLSDGAVSLVRLASVLGSTFPLHELSGLTGEPLEDLAGPLDELDRDGVLTVSGTRARFEHDLLRETLYHAVPASTRTALHRDCARYLAGTGAPPERVAHHAELGAPPLAIAPRPDGCWRRPTTCGPTAHIPPEGGTSGS